MSVVQTVAVQRVDELQAWALTVRQRVLDMVVALGHGYVGQGLGIFDGEALLALGRRVRVLLTVENGTVVGGLAGAVAETLARAGNAPPLLTLGVQDEFPVAGSLDFLLEQYRLTPAHIAKAATAALAARSLAEG